MILPDQDVDLDDEATGIDILSTSIKIRHETERKNHFDKLNELVNHRFRYLILLEMITNQAFLETVLYINYRPTGELIEKHWNLNRICNNSLRKFLKTNQVDVKAPIEHCIVYQMPNERIIRIKHSIF